MYAIHEDKDGNIHRVIHREGKVYLSVADIYIAQKLKISDTALLKILDDRDVDRFKISAPHIGKNLKSRTYFVEVCSLHKAIKATDLRSRKYRESKVDFLRWLETEFKVED